MYFAALIQFLRFHVFLVSITGFLRVVHKWYTPAYFYSGLPSRIHLVIIIRLIGVPYVVRIIQILSLVGFQKNESRFFPHLVGLSFSAGTGFLFPLM